MNCKNKEKFPISTIMFDQIYIKDNDGNILFKLNNYINQKQFACEVGILEYNIKSSSTSEPTSSSSSSSSWPSSSSSWPSPLPTPTPKPKSSDSKSILSKFYIIIVIIVIIFIIALVIYCYYKNSGKKPLTDESISDVESLNRVSQISNSN